MRDKNIVRYTRDDLPRDETDWERVRRMTDEEIDEAARSDPDAQPTDAGFWKDARRIMPENERSASVRLDRDVLNWFMSRDEACQSHINTVLRAYIDHQEKIN